MPEEFVAGDDGKLRAVRVRNAETGETEELEVGGAFVAIGHIPRSELVAGQVDTDEDGYVLTEGKSTRTKLGGVFAVGDLVDHTYRQAVTAAGTGCMGALDAEWYLRDTPPSPEAHWLRGGEPVEVAPNPGRLAATQSRLRSGRRGRACWTIEPRGRRASRTRADVVVLVELVEHVRRVGARGQAVAAAREAGDVELLAGEGSR